MAKERGLKNPFPRAGKSNKNALNTKICRDETNSARLFLISFFLLFSHWSIRTVLLLLYYGWNILQLQTCKKLALRVFAAHIHRCKYSFARYSLRASTTWTHKYVLIFHSPISFMFHINSYPQIHTHTYNSNKCYHVLGYQQEAYEIEHSVKCQTMEINNGKYDWVMIMKKFIMLQKCVQICKCKTNAKDLPQFATHCRAQWTVRMLFVKYLSQFSKQT